MPSATSWKRKLRLCCMLYFNQSSVLRGKPMKISHFAFRIFNLILIAVLMAGCGGQTPPQPTKKPNDTPTPRKTATPAPSPTPNEAIGLLSKAGSPAPQVISAGGSIARDGVVEVRFSQPMDATTTAAAFTLLDASGAKVDGSVEWPSPDRLHFKPAQPLNAGSRYEASLKEDAKSAKGDLLKEASTLSYEVTGAIGVGQAFPANGTENVANNSTITVLFDRPVVALRIAEEQSKQPDPLKIEPAVEGKGEWVNTSVYVFRPKTYLQSNTLYTVTVVAGLADATGGGSAPLTKDVTWSFHTMRPVVQDLSFLLDGDPKNPISITTNNTFDKTPLDATLRLNFLQPMDHPATEAAVTFTAPNQPDAKLTFTWADDSLSVIVKPTERLALDSMYSLKLAGSARAVDGGTMDADIIWNLATYSSPKITLTRPSNGEGSADSGMFEVYFASPMKVQSVVDKITFDPPLEKQPQDQNWSYDPYNFNIYFYGLVASTSYKVKLDAGMQDIYGNVIADAKEVKFTTAPLSPYAYWAAPQQIQWRANTPGAFYMNVTNVKKTHVTLSRISMKDLLNFTTANSQELLTTFRPAKDAVQWQTDFAPDVSADRSQLAKVTLEKPVPTGVYLLGLEADGVPHPNSTYNDLRIVVVSSVSITIKTSPSEALIWVTDQSSGKPVAGAPVELYRFVDGTKIGTGNTDKDGLLKIALPALPAGIDFYAGGTYNALVGNAGDLVFGFSGGFVGSGVWPGDFGISANYYASPQADILYLYTERPIYRPGQTVYFKGVLRKDNDLSYSLPDVKSLNVVINSFDKEVSRTKVDVSDYGTFNGTFQLDKDAALGTYYLKVFYDGQEDNYLNGISFNVAEYRRPEFQVMVNAAAANILAGDTFNANIKAEYYSGGGVANADVHWVLRAQPFTFTPPDAYSRYRFNDVQMDEMQDPNMGRVADSDVILAEGSAKTDAQGQLSLTVPAKLEKAVSQKLVLEATITDLSQASVSGRAEIIANQSMVYPGIRFADYVGQANKDQTIDLVALDWDGKPLPNQKVTVEVVERRWHSVQEQSPNGDVRWNSSVEEIPVKTFTDVVMGADGKGSITFNPPNGGVFRARVTSADGKGKIGAAADYTWVTGADFIPWRQGNDRSFQLITDRETYKPGDTAQVLIASPFQGQNYALLTVERGLIRQQKVILLQNNSTIYSLPITADFAPNVYISVQVMKGVDKDTPFPDYRIGMAEIKVSTEKQTLNVDVTPDKKTAGPGDTINYTVHTSDSDGKPVSAEVSLGLSDLSTLSLVGPNSGTMLSRFYDRRSLSVSTNISIINSLEAYNNSLAESPLAMGRGQGSGGGLKGDGALGVLQIRQDFPDTAFWKADVRTDAAGQASVSVKLPDNLTIWRMDARAVTLDTRVGQTLQDLTSTKPLLVRPQTPRFFVAGDQLMVGTAVHNNTDQDMSVEVALDAQNLTLTSPQTQSVQVAAHQQAYVTWQVTVPDGADTAQLTFSAKGGQYEDASRPTIGAAGTDGLPILRYEAPETVGTSGQMTENGSRAEGIMLPQDWNITQGQLVVSVSPSLSASLTNGLTYLKSYPYECVEQTVSRFLPNVVIARVLREAKMNNPEVEAGLTEQVNIALQRLASQENADGGWPYWKPSPSDDLVTAYVVLGLIEAKASGYPVPDKMINDGLDYLSYHVNSPHDDRMDPKAVDNRAAFTLYVLTRGGRKPVEDINKLYDRRVNLQIYARAYLTQAIWRIDSQDPRLNTLRSDLNSAAVLSASGTHWEEASHDVWNWSTDTRTTAIVLDALEQIDPKNPIVANGVRWLMAHRTSGHWQGTQETAWSLLALADWMSVSGELKGNYSFAVGFADKTISQGDVNAQNLQQVTTTLVMVKDLLKDTVNKLVFARTGGDGTLYYTANLNVWLPVKDIKSLNQGVMISRTYTRANASDTPITSAEQGELLRVRLSITAPAGLNYLVVNDPLPAGFEAVDSNLLSNPQGMQPEQSAGNDWETNGWGWWYFNHAELRDDRVVLSANYLPAGTYSYTYVVRASSKGIFNVIPPTAQEFYFPEVYGRGDGMQFEVK